MFNLVYSIPCTVDASLMSQVTLPCRLFYRAKQSSRPLPGIKYPYWYHCPMVSFICGFSFATKRLLPCHDSKKEDDIQKKKEGVSVCGHCSSTDSRVCRNSFRHIKKQEDIWSASQIKRCCCVLKSLYTFLTLVFTTTKT